MFYRKEVLPLLLSLHLFQSANAFATQHNGHDSKPAAIDPRCGELLANQTVELSETEAKFLVPDLSRLPHDIVKALQTGASHPSILRRGFVVQEYLPVTRENLERFFSLLQEANIPFGTEAQQAEFLTPGKAKEIRMMSKSIKIDDMKTVIFQATVKGAGGLSVEQLESPENLTAEQLDKMKSIFDSLRPEVNSVVRKVYFEPLATDHHGHVLKRKNGSPYTVELDMFIGKSGIEDGPIFLNGEIEFHGTTQEEAIAEASIWQKDSAQRPPYFSQDLTEAKGVKSRDIAVKGAPEFITTAIAPHKESNDAIFKKIAREFLTWADPHVEKLITSKPNEYSIPNRENTGTHPVRVIDPVVFEPSDKDAFTQFFKDNGYVVLDHISEPQNRDAVVALMQNIVEKNIPNTRRLGFMDLYHDDALAQMRQNPALYKVFSELFGTEKLWVVFDRVMYWNHEEGEKPLPPHVDQNPVKHPNFFNVQAMLALRDMNEGTGTLALVPQSHLSFQNYSQWTKPGAGFIEYQGTNALPFVALRLKEGQIIIWDSRTTHSRFRGAPSGTRFAALLTYTPAQNNPELIQERMKYFNEGIGWNNHDAGLRATARPRYEQPLRQNKENLTPLGRKLYGLESWFSND